MTTCRAPPPAPGRRDGIGGAARAGADVPSKQASGGGRKTAENTSLPGRRQDGAGRNLTIHAPAAHGTRVTDASSSALASGGGGSSRGGASASPRALR